MRVPGVKTVRQWLRRLRAGLVDHAVVLGYHRIARAPWDPYSLCVSPDHFEEQLSLLSRYADSVSLRDLVGRLKSGGELRNAVVVTFDDGYADSLYSAKPLLETYGVPATVFVSTGNLGREFWWDELARAVHALPPDATRLEVELGSTLRRWDLRPIAEGASPEHGGSGRRELLVELFRLCRSLSAAQRSEVVSQVRDRVGERFEVEPWHRALTPDEVTAIGQGELIEIGAHSVTHSVLTALDRGEQEREILESRRSLEGLAGREVVSFSFPHGVVSSDALECLQAAGFVCACGSGNDVVVESSHPLRLPRIWAQDHGSEDFSRWLGPWVGGVRALSGGSRRR